MILRDGGIFTWPPKWYLEALKGWQWLKTSLGPLHGGICGGNIVEYHGDEGVGGGAGRAFVLQATKESEHGGQKACHVCCTLPVAIPFYPQKFLDIWIRLRYSYWQKNTHPPTQPPTKCWSWKLSPILCHKSQLCMFFIIWGLLIIKPLLSATLLLTTMTDWVIYVMLFSLYYLTNGSQVDGDDAKKVQKHLQDTWNLSLDSKLWWNVENYLWRDLKKLNLSILGQCPARVVIGNSRSEKWKKSFTSPEKWNLNVIRSFWQVKAKMPRDRDQRVTFLENKKNIDLIYKINN